MKPKVLLTGFGPFLHHQKNFTGWFLKNLFDPKVFNSEFHLIAPSLSGTEDTSFEHFRFERAFKLQGQEILCCAMGLEVVWEKAAEKVIQEMKFANYDLVLMFGIGKQDFVFEAGSLNQNKEGGLLMSSYSKEHQFSFSWPTQKLQKKLQSAFEKNQFQQICPQQARPENVYICNDLSFRVLEEIQNWSKKPMVGFLHFPSTLSFDLKNLQFSSLLVQQIIEICRTD